MPLVWQSSSVRYVRYQAAEPNQRGTFPGVFALVNWLDFDGLLGPEARAWKLEANVWLTANLTDPATVDPTIFDRSLHPMVSCWFAESAAMFLERVPPYLALLDTHGIGWSEVRSADPGIVLYRDEHQVVVEPHPSAN
jgi:hypothetical protein